MTDTSTPASATQHRPKYYLKFLDHDRMPAHGGVGQWPAPGTWTEEVEPILCRQGWHLCRKQDIIRWMQETLWVVEAYGEPITDPEQNNKVVARRARLVRQVEEWCPRNQRLFAADCAEHVLHNFKSKYPQDTRPRRAIETARRFALGEATLQELDAAESGAVFATDSAAWAAAWYAARSAAWAATESAAWYAAGSAAESAAESAARSATASATGSAVVSAAWSASAAYSAERNWQLDHLFQEYLKLDPNDFH